MGVVRKLKQLGRIKEGEKIKSQALPKSARKLLVGMWKLVQRVNSPHKMAKIREGFMNVIPVMIAKGVRKAPDDQKSQEITKTIATMNESQQFREVCNKLDITDADIEIEIRKALNLLDEESI